MAPTAFAVKLESGVATGEVGFTNKGDVPLVTGIYDKAFMTEMTKATELSYALLRWDDAQGVQLCEALRHAHAHGGLRELKRLYLGGNKLGNGFVTALVALLDEGGLANVVRGGVLPPEQCDLRRGHAGARGRRRARGPAQVHEPPPWRQPGQRRACEGGARAAPEL